MTKVYPNPITPSASGNNNQSVFTVWNKSLLFNCDGYTVLDTNGNLVFRVDNYVAGGNGEIVLMDAYGHCLLTIRRQRLSLSETWNVYDGETARFSVTKHMNLLKDKLLASVSIFGGGWKKRKAMYEMEASYSSGERWCVVYDENRRCVADMRNKEAKAGVGLGGDVFRLVVQPTIDPTLAMALLIVLHQMLGSSTRHFS